MASSNRLWAASSLSSGFGARGGIRTPILAVHRAERSPDGRFLFSAALSLDARKMSTQLTFLLRDPTNRRRLLEPLTRLFDHLDACSAPTWTASRFVGQGGVVRGIEGRRAGADPDDEDLRSIRAHRDAKG
jgi:hypothetical protein